MDTERQLQHDSLELTERKLASLVENGLLLSREKNRDVLFKKIVSGAREIAHCELVTLFLRTEHDTLSFAIRTGDDPLPNAEIPLYNPDGTPCEQYIVSYVTHHKKSVLIDDVYKETDFDLSGTKKFSEQSGFRTISMLTVPLSSTNGKVLGCCSY